MSVRFVLVERGNQIDHSAPRMWYAQARSTGKVGTRQLSRLVSERCTVNRADVLAVIDAMSQVMLEQLQCGQIVQWDDFGSFAISIGSEGAPTKQEFKTAMIDSRRIVFRPSNILRKSLKNLNFQRWWNTDTKSTEPSEQAIEPFEQTAKRVSRIDWLE